MSLTTERPVNTAPWALATRERTRITIDTADIPRLPLHVRLLDLGHGFTMSPLLQDLRTHNPDTEFDTFKLDYFPENLAILGGIRVAADAAALPFRPETFDVVTSAQLTKDNPYFRHMPGRLTDMAREVGRILRPGGLYLVYNEVPNVVTPPGFKTVFEIRQPQFVDGCSFSGLLYGVYRKQLRRTIRPRRSGIR